MYFSRLQINPRRREARKLLANPRAMHAAVESSFPPLVREDMPGRVLWRVDEAANSVTLYVVSPGKPDMTHIQESAGWETAPAESVPYGKFLNRIQNGEQYRFRVTVNPVKRLYVPGKRGKIVPHLTEAQQLDWFTQRQSQWGFQVLTQSTGGGENVAEHLMAEVVKRADRSFSKLDDGRKHNVTQRQVTIDGALVVADADLLRLSLTGGMGRGKAYGSGLMTLMTSIGTE